MFIQSKLSTFRHGIAHERPSSIDNKFFHGLLAWILQQVFKFVALLKEVMGALPLIWLQLARRRCALLIANVRVSIITNQFIAMPSHQPSSAHI